VLQRCRLDRREARVIALTDRISLAPDVTLDGDVVIDPVRRLRVAASPAAVLVLAHADGRTIAAVGELLTRYGAEDGQRDALEFSKELSRRLLVNVTIGPVAFFRRYAAAARRGILVHLPPRRVRWLPAGLGLAAGVLTAVTAPVALLLGAWLLVNAVVLGVVLHEAAHAVSLRGIPRALVLNGVMPSVLHPPLFGARAVVVAVAGPIVPALAGLLVVAPWHTLAPACAPLAAHALGLTVLAPDGRNACGLS
jgi:hypothetical protein